MQTYFQSAAVMLGLVLYGILISKLVRDNTQQSLATWALWGFLDLITLVSIIKQDGNWIVLALYVLGCTVICTILAIRKQFSWGIFENFTMLLVGICLMLWYIGGPAWGMFSGTTSVALASLPQIRDSFKRPDPNTVSIWLGFLTVNTLYFLAGKSWEPKEILYPIVCIVLCLLLTLANMSKPTDTTY